MDEPIFDRISKDELAAVARRIALDIRQGGKLDDLITQAQFDLGLSYTEASRINNLIREAAEPLSRLLDPEDPIDMVILDLISSYGDAVGPNAMGSDARMAVRMLADRCNELVKSQESAEVMPNLPADPSISPEASYKVAGLKSTLRKLRKQLNGHDAEDLDGMNKLLSAIKGIEEQLDQKEKKREERAKNKKSDAPASDSDEDGADDDAKVEAALRAEADGELPPGDEPASRADDANPVGPQAPLPTGPAMVENRVNLASKLEELKAKLAETEALFKAAVGLDAMQGQALEQEPLLMEWLRTMESHRALMEKAGQKWSVLLVDAKSTPKAAQILAALEKQITALADEGDKVAMKLQNSLKSLKSSPKYQLEKKPYIMTAPTPKDFQQDPHMKAPSEQGRAASRRTADGLLSQLQRTVSPLMDSLSSLLQDIVSLVDVAESRVQVAA